MDPPTRSPSVTSRASDSSTVRSISRQHSTIRARPQSTKRPSDASAVSESVTDDADKSRTLTSFPPLPPTSPPSTHNPKDPRPSLPKLGGAPFSSPTLRTAQPKPSVPAALADLFAPAAADVQGRGALFDDAHPASNGAHHVPGTLHHQGNVHIEHLIARVGAVALVKQLSADLAQRDAQVTALQRRAEERERLLRRMLKECEVSNMDIETRLREAEEEGRRKLTRGDAAAASGQDDQSGEIGEQMCEALGEDITTHGGEVSSGENSRRPSGQSVNTSTGESKVKLDTAKAGWKGYFKYGGGTAKATDTKAADQGTVKQKNGDLGGGAATIRGRSNGQRPGPGSRTPSAAASLQDHLLAPTKNADDTTDSASVKSSSSVTSWAMKLVGGRPAGQADALKQHGRTKAASISGETRPPERARPDSLHRTMSRNELSPGAVRHSRVDSLATQLRNTAAASLPFPNSPPEIDDTGMANLGPVEMETILPDDIRPPTLAENPAASGYLTDRFGFIYDQRRRKRQNEAAAIVKQKHGNMVETLDSAARSLSAFSDPDDEASVNSRSSSAAVSRPDSPFSAVDVDGQKGWSDYLNIFSMKGELLSHTPAAAPIASITAIDEDVDLTNTKAPNILMSKRGSEPALASITAPTTDRAVSEHAELAAPTAASQNQTPEEPQPDPVQALLAQLTDVHDKLQRERTSKWNDFLRRVRAERTRAGDAASGRDRRSKTIAVPMPETLLSDGEIIGVAGLGNKGKVGRAKWAEFRSLVLSGIPVAYRAKIWAECSGASALRHPGYYEELVGSGEKDKLHDPSVAQQIQMDIHRTLTDNIFFRAGQGVSKLNEVLLAYARRNPDVGYCQGMNLIAANLLLIMPAAEDAFWVLCSMIESILPAKYFDSSLLTSRADQVVLRGYVTEVLPQLSAHLHDLNIDLEAFTFQWFLSVFTDCLSAEALFRVWDVVLCINDGATFLFQVALALLKLNEKQLLASKGPAEVYAYISQHMTDHAISIDGLIRASEGLRKVVKREDVIKRRTEAVERELETIRERDALRKGKGKARAEALADFPMDDGDTPPASDAGDSFSNPDRRPAAQRLLSTDKQSIGSTATPPSEGRRSRRHSFESDDDLTPGYGELTVRTPMPMEEEASWMA